MRKWWNYLVSTNRTLAYGVAFHVVLLLLILTLFPFDDRKVLGINVWIKPIKFSLSIIIFLISTILILQPLPYSKQQIKVLSWILLGCMLFEIFCIVLQSARGERSHFNDTDAIGSFLFPLMGTAISIIFIVYCVIFISYLRLSTALPKIMQWAIPLGIFIFLFGAISGFTMASIMRHSIGTIDGGPGLPFVNWSTVAGDLRVSHFLSLHALQVIPIVGYTVYKKLSNQKVGLAITIIFALIYFSFDVFVLIQAFRGEPFLSG